MIKSFKHLRKLFSYLYLLQLCAVSSLGSKLILASDEPIKSAIPAEANLATDKKLIAPGETAANSIRRSPAIYAGLSIVPGLGQAAQGRYLKGIGYFSTVFLGALIPNRDTRNIATFIWSYNIYDAFRDAGGKDTSQESFFENFVATFNPLNILDPHSAAGVAVGLSGALINKTDRNQAYHLRDALIEPVRMAFVGLGEEALFRGFMFPAISDMTTSYWAGAIASSAIFSAYHFTGWGLEAFRPDFFTVRLIGGLFGCWQTYRNRFDLRKSIFTHAWFDVFYFYDSNGILNGTGPNRHLGFAPNQNPGLGLKFSFPIE